uniref:Uncharacterized protein n=1 Tax=Tanacetum cinerariifolium TaxID=118510 RepID=A0A699GSF9_TANCI|nr:hypothetical protein [Tanacetum cinerariifolium]
MQTDSSRDIRTEADEEHIRQIQIQQRGPTKVDISREVRTKGRACGSGNALELVFCIPFKHSQLCAIRILLLKMNHTPNSIPTTTGTNNSDHLPDLSTTTGRSSTLKCSKNSGYSIWRDQTLCCGYGTENNGGTVSFKLEADKRGNYLLWYCFWLMNTSLAGYSL